MSIWFVTPAFRRYELSAVCFDQRQLVMERLAAEGIEAQCVVVADDENLRLAEERGFAIVLQSNEWLGRKFNDGIEYACRQGAEWIVPIGSDSWIDPAYFLPLPTPDQIRTSALYNAVRSSSVAELHVGRHGAGPFMFHRSLLERVNFRPAMNRIHSGVDSSTVRGLGGSRNLPWVRHNVHQYQYVGFRGDVHITSYAKLLSKWGIREDTDPRSRLVEHYPAGLVDRALAAIP